MRGAVVDRCCRKDALFGQRLWRFCILSMKGDQIDSSTFFIGGFTKQDGRKKRAVKHFLQTNMTGLLLMYYKFETTQNKNLNQK